MISRPNDYDADDESVTLRFTAQLRTSDETLWVDIRDRLEREGESASRSAVATLFPDDVALEYGLIVTSSGRVFELEVGLARDEGGRLVRAPRHVISFVELEPERKKEVFPSHTKAAQEMLHLGEL